MSRRNLEAYFRGQGLSYVDVQQASQELGAEPRPGAEHLLPFAFVVYMTEGENLLVCTEGRTEETVSLMTSWAKLFGKGFKPVFAKFKTHPQFWSLHGTQIPTPSRAAPKRPAQDQRPDDIDQSLPAEMIDCPSQLALF